MPGPRSRVSEESQWVTTPGAAGTVRVERTAEGRLVADLEPFDRDVRVLFEERAVEVAASGAERVRIEVIAFRRARSPGPHYLTARLAEEDGAAGADGSTATTADERDSTDTEPPGATEWPGREGRSLVGDAKARADRQQRDAAIAPPFSPLENRNHLLNEASEKDGSDASDGK